MINPKEGQAIMAERKQRLLRQARIHQLYYQSEKERVHFGSRALALLGDLMIASGHKLKERSGEPSRWKLQKS